MTEYIPRLSFEYSWYIYIYIYIYIFHVYICFLYYTYLLVSICRYNGDTKISVLCEGFCNNSRLQQFSFNLQARIIQSHEALQTLKWLAHSLQRVLNFEVGQPLFPCFSGRAFPDWLHSRVQLKRSNSQLVSGTTPLPFLPCSRPGLQNFQLVFTLLSYFHSLLEAFVSSALSRWRAFSSSVPSLRRCACACTLTPHTFALHVRSKTRFWS